MNKRLLLLTWTLTKDNKPRESYKNTSNGPTITEKTPFVKV